jgi:hypothetical protein
VCAFWEGMAFPHNMCIIFHPEYCFYFIHRDCLKLMMNLNVMKMEVFKPIFYLRVIKPWDNLVKSTMWDQVSTKHIFLFWINSLHISMPLWISPATDPIRSTPNNCPKCNNNRKQWPKCRVMIPPFFTWQILRSLF